MCILVSHLHWNRKWIGDPNSFAADWELLSNPYPPPTYSISPSLLQDVWTGYLSVRPGLGKAIATASASWCRSTAPPAVISVTVRHSSKKQQQSRWKKSFLSIEQRKELLWTVCQWSNGSQQVQPCSAAMGVFKNLIWRDITLATEKVCV